MFSSAAKRGPQRRLRLLDSLQHLHSRLSIRRPPFTLPSRPTRPPHASTGALFSTGSSTSSSVPKASSGTWFWTSVIDPVVFLCGFEGKRKGRVRTVRAEAEGRPRGRTWENEGRRPLLHPGLRLVPNLERTPRAMQPTYIYRNRTASALPSPSRHSQQRGQKARVTHVGTQSRPCSA